MENQQTGRGVESWASHHIPAGSAVRYVLNAEHDDPPIRLVIGDREQVELEMTLPEAASIATALQDAGREVRARRGRP